VHFFLNGGVLLSWSGT